MLGLVGRSCFRISYVGIQCQPLFSSSNIVVVHSSHSASKMGFSRGFCASSDRLSKSETLFFSPLKAQRAVVSARASSLLAELFLCFESTRNASVFQTISRGHFDLLHAKIEWLERVLRFSQKAWLHEQPVLKDLLAPPASYKRVELDVVGAVEMLSVRCRVVAYSGTYLKELVAQRWGGQEDPDLILENIRKTCDEIKTELVSCDACVEELRERATNLFGRREGVGRRSEWEKGVEEVTATGPEPPPPGRVRDRVVQDEVFEGVAAPSPSEGGGSAAGEPWTRSLRRERRMKRKQRERCRRVLREIQPILQKRREMWIEREAEALRRRGENSEPSPMSNDSGVSSPGDEGASRLGEADTPQNGAWFGAPNDQVSS